MPVFLLKIVFIVLSNLSYFLSRFIFSTVAYLLVLVIQAFRLPGQNAKGLLEQVAEAIRGLLEYLLGIGVDAITTMISTSFELLKEGAFGSASVFSSAIAGLLEQTRASLEGALKDVPELFEGFKDMVSTIATDLWNNYNEALAYLKDNA